MGTAKRVLGANTLRLYQWRPNENHKPFLDHCKQRGLKVLLPISNNVAFSPNWRADTTAIVRASKAHLAVAMWVVTNELDRDPKCRNNLNW